MLKNKKFKLLTNLSSVAVGIGCLSVFSFMTLASALPLSRPHSSTQGSNTSSGSTTNGSSGGSLTNTTGSKQTAIIQSIISRGNSEIERRLASLSSLDSKISASTKLSKTDQATLTTTVNNEVSGLTALKVTLDGATTASTVRTAAQSIINGYRVYALICPQVNIVSAADHQQNVEAKLTALETELATRINSSSSSTLQTDLSTITSDTAAAQKLSSTVETGVIVLTPTNYDQDHTVLAQYMSDLQTAQTDNQNAYLTAKTMVGLLTGSTSVTSSTSMHHQTTTPPASSSTNN